MMQANAAGTNNQTTIDANKQKEPVDLFSRWRTTFYHYDPVGGTSTKLLPCAVLITASTAAGSALGYVVANNLPSGRARFQRAVVEYAVKTVEDAIQQNPLICGASAGFTASLVGIYMLGSSLKPVTVRGIQCARRTVTQRLRKQCTTVLRCQKEIDDHRQRLSLMRPKLETEIVESKKRADADFSAKMSIYNEQFNAMAAKLTGVLASHCISAVSTTAPPSYDEIEREARGIHRNDCYVEAAAQFTYFVCKRENNWSSRKQLLTALEPILSEQKLDSVRTILQNGPSKPYYWLPKGPIEQVCEQYRRDISYCTDRSRSAIKDRDRILSIYPELQPKITHQPTEVEDSFTIPEMPLDLFRESMPD